MPREDFEPTISVVKRSKTVMLYSLLDRNSVAHHK